MNTSAWLTILPFLGAVAGAIIGATISPLVQWQFEKKRQKLAYRRELIIKWRTMFEEIARNCSPTSPAAEITSALMNRGEYFSFLMHTKDAPRTMLAEDATLVSELGLHPILAAHLQEVLVLEKRWRLI